MSVEAIFQQTAQRDPTWGFAYAFVKKELKVPSHVTRLFKSGWYGDTDPKEYLKVLGFSRLNPACLLDAAEQDAASLQENGAESIEHAISYLGIRLSAVVLAVNLANRRILAGNPPVGWKSFLKDMVTDIEIGYRLGAKAPEVGVEGGALIGFARHAGLGLLMAYRPEKYKKYQSLLRDQQKVSPEEEVALFGCEAYQVAAFVLQQLGFGSEIALGIALGAGRLDTELFEADHEILRWKAAYHWIDSLKRGRNFPADMEMRNFFGELKPSSGPDRNLNLETLYTEVARVKRNGSQWTWHLPKQSYEETAEQFGLQ